MPYIECTILARGDAREAYEIAKNMEEYPKFMENLENLTVVERGEGYTITDWLAKVDGRDFKWQERDVFDDENLTITYKQTAGDLKKFEGQWTFDKEEDGTKITLTVDFEMGIPVLAGLLNPILKKKVKSNSDAMLEAIKRKVEKTG
ncbi:MAG: aromatase/cyclase [Firmicutes bacterium]|nr:aromatase/cyclase [Bacillota bacterium]